MKFIIFSKKNNYLKKFKGYYKKNEFNYWKRMPNYISHNINSKDSNLQLLYQFHSNYQFLYILIAKSSLYQTQTIKIHKN